MMLVTTFVIAKLFTMFDIKNPDTFLGGQNVHNLIIIGMLGYIIYKKCM